MRSSVFKCRQRQLERPFHRDILDVRVPPCSRIHFALGPVDNPVGSDSQHALRSFHPEFMLDGDPPKWLDAIIWNRCHEPLVKMVFQERIRVRKGFVAQQFKRLLAIYAEFPADILIGQD